MNRGVNRAQMNPNYFNARRLQPAEKLVKPWLRRAMVLAGGILSACFTALPMQAAERIYLDYRPLNTSISIQALETYAEAGEADSELSAYLSLLSSEHQAQLRELLQMRFRLNPTQLSQAFQAPMGQIVLNEMGEVIQVKADKNGAIALQAALLQAAKNPEGFTLITLLQQFPGEIQINLEKVLDLTQQITAVQQDTKALVKSIETLTNIAAKEEPSINFNQLDDVRISGDNRVIKETLRLTDQNRDRKLIVHLYVPEKLSSEPESTPVIIISPGLGATPNTWQHLVQHLGSHGYVVATIQHPGSNFNHLQAFLQGFESDVFRTQEFIDRPLDVTYVIDELERRNLSHFQGKLNLKQVGVAGQSFGAYTALAVAGAPLNFEQLKQDCRPPIELVNLSRLLQCQALELPHKNYDLKDDRIGAAFIADPVSSSVLGQSSLSQVTIPVFWGAGSEDRLTPVVLEQMYAFGWLGSANKYLALTQGSQHLNLNVDALEDLDTLNQDALKQLVSRNQPILESYVNALSLAFFQVYLAGDLSYQPYLRSSYALAISQDPYTLSFLSALTSEQLIEVMAQVIGQE